MTIFDPRRNSIGFMRVVMATAVIVSHAWPLGGFGHDPGRENNNLGFLAVEGFFALSGFLITRSGEHLSTGRFLWHRILRIMPAFWVCLVMITLLFAPIVWRASHGFTEYPNATPNPFGFVLNNFLLANNQQQIGDTLAGNPYPTLWNGPMYTLPYEFACYLIVCALAAMRVLNRRVVGAIFIAAWLWQQVVLSNVLGASDGRQATLTACFLFGSLIYLWRDVVFDRNVSWWLFGVCLVVATSTYVSVGFRQIGVFAFTYVIIWAGARLPFTRVGTKRDFSYGLYIYGWPVLQVASFFGLNALGLPAYLAIVLLITGGLAASSWYLVESRALRLKNVSVPGWLRGRDVPKAVEQLQSGRATRAQP
ncbi:acyltransferase family protein [Plantibacter sp. YIM 135249]|uniref:acyltransferase family protein n=1 Tax=Plantibacter sp. YIM 135249 TaxID=3423918 RepID=UPI003D342B60